MSIHSPVQLQTLTLGLGYGNRRTIEEEIARLISLLDMFDGDCEIEDDSEDRCVFEDEGPDTVSRCDPFRALIISAR